MNRRQWPWYLLQSAIILGMVYLVTVVDERPDLAAASVILGVVASAIVMAILFRLSDWRARRGIRQVDESHSDSGSLPRTGRHPGDGAKLVGRTRVR